MRPPGEEKGYRPYLWKFCLGQEDFVKGELAHIKRLSRVMSSTALDRRDGPSTCYCDECVRQLREKGLDPFDGGAQYITRLRFTTLFSSASAK